MKKEKEKRDNDVKEDETKFKLENLKNNGWKKKWERKRAF